MCSSRHGNCFKLKEVRMEGGDAMKQGDFVCTTCGYIGDPITMTPGSFLVELVLWLLMIAPGLIYTVWRFSGRYKGCPSCKKATMIPVSSPFGQKIVTNHDQDKSVSSEVPKIIRHHSQIANLASDYINKMSSKS